MSASPPPPTNIAAEFADHLVRVRLRALRTAENYAQVADALVDFAGSPAAATGADTTMLRQFLSGRASRDVATARSSWNTRRSALRAFFGFLVDRGMRQDDPTGALERYRPPYREATVLSLQEMIRLVEAVERDSSPLYRSRNVALVQVMIHTALRVSEVCSLTVQQVDLQEHVFRSVRRKGAKVFDAPFNDVVAEALERYLGDRQHLCRGRSETALFLSDRGSPLAKRTLQETVSSYARRAGIARAVSPHALRHGCATALAALGVPMRTIQEVCGHASVATTERYVHVAGRQRHDAVARLGEAFRTQRAGSGGVPP